jgi:small subunit ribosomal protein S1
MKQVNPLPENLSEETPVADDASSFAAILSEFEQQHKGNARSETVQGTVVAVTPEFVYIDIGRKNDGVLTAEQFHNETGQVNIKAGTPMLVSIKGRNSEGYYELSTVKVERPKDWTALEKAFNDKLTIGGVVVETVKGGLRVDVGVRAFLPASRSGVKDQATLEKLVGQEIQCRIIKLDTANEDVVVDRRVVLEEEESKSRDRAFSTLEEGAEVSGTVRGLTEFGAFVDLGGIDGLLHVADMSWSRVNKPADVVAVGDSVKVKILKINRDTRKISLGMKQLIPDPWTLAAGKYKDGDRVKGKVVRLADFGAFVELEPGVDGLVHLSELSWSKKIRKPADVVNAGDVVEVVVLKVDPTEKRISLGLKQALGDPWAEAEKKYIPGITVEGPVTSLTKFGAFIDLGDGLDGMVHIADITREKRLDHPKDALAVGQQVKAMVLDLDKERRRIRLGIKQLEPTSVDEYIAERRVGEAVTGRVVEVHGGKAKVELGEGVFATCALAAEAAAASPSLRPAASSVDLKSLTAQLSAKWKSGAGTSAAAEELRAGQVRTFRITGLDARQKRVEIIPA